MILDQEAGEYVFRGVMEPGYYCRVLADSTSAVKLHLHPTARMTENSTSNHSSSSFTNSTLQSVIETNPAAMRKLTFDLLPRDERQRIHAVCTVQTFRNKQTGFVMSISW